MSKNQKLLNKNKTILMTEFPVGAYEFRMTTSIFIWEQWKLVFLGDRKLHVCLSVFLSSFPNIHKCYGGLSRMVPSGLLYVWMLSLQLVELFEQD